TARRARHLGLAGLTGEDLALVEAHDDLRGDELDHLGRGVADTRALRLADRTWALFGRDGDRVGDATQTGRRRPPARRLLRGLRLLVRLTAAVLLGGVAQLLVRLAESALHRGAELIDEEVELVLGHALATVRVAHLCQELLELRVPRDELRHHC